MRRSSSERGRGQVQGRGRGWGQGLGGTFVGRGVRMLRQGPLRINQSSPFKIAKSFSRTKGLLWRHDLFEDSIVAAGLAGSEGGTKLYISNLDYGVSNEDIKELFSKVGDLKRSATHFDRNGRPSGSAEVVYARRSDAIAAVKRYNNVQLDGKPMKIEIIGNNLGLPIAPRVNVVGGANGRGKRTVVMTPEFGQGTGSFKQLLGWNRARGRGRGHSLGQTIDAGIARGRNLRGRGRGLGRGGTRGRGRGRGGKQLVRKTAEDLDKELETYHAGAMDTS
ncbi:THO complex subunit 4D isoform X1 [Dendrobium catenatum]|uniref:THO complex subunit 4D isoform X1 n=1 Tax=Dendrobium catenatum TaxID=906689 RepID=UPI0009F62729|nr:THO complex subunit 4D isoform X1 [Dendrobium catenatum]